MTDASIRTEGAAASGSPPRWTLIGMALLALATIAIAGLARQTGIGVTGVPESPTVAAVDLDFEDRADGSALVRDGTGALLATLAVSQDGFVRGAMRSLTRQRQIEGVGQDRPFRLERRANGRLSLSDPATGGRIELDAFGPGNAAAFARFLPAREGRP